VYFKTNKRFLREGYPAIADYVRDLYQTPGITESVNMYHIKVMPVIWYQEPQSNGDLLMGHAQGALRIMLYGLVSKLKLSLEVRKRGLNYLIVLKCLSP
jgi:hypothetical protein